MKAITHFQTRDGIKHDTVTGAMAHLQDKAAGVIGDLLRECDLKSSTNIRIGVILQHADKMREAIAWLDDAKLEVNPDELADD